MLPSPNCEAFIKSNEGLILTVRPDAGGNSIGYGHDLLPGESFPNGIDEAEAEALFQSDLAVVAQCINENVIVPLTQNQWDSLADFVYNEGRGTFQSSTLLKLLNMGQYEQVPYQWYHVDESGQPHGFIFSEGKILSALITRRQAEIALWETP